MFVVTTNLGLQKLSSKEGSIYLIYFNFLWNLTQYRLIKSAVIFIKLLHKYHTKECSCTEYQLIAILLILYLTSTKQTTNHCSALITTHDCRYRSFYFIIFIIFVKIVLLVSNVTSQDKETSKHLLQEQKRYTRYIDILDKVLPGTFKGKSLTPAPSGFQAEDVSIVRRKHLPLDYKISLMRWKV